MGNQLSAGSFIVYPIDNSKSRLWIFWKKMGNICLLSSLVLFIISLFLPQTFSYRYFGFLWLVIAVCGAFIYTFRYFSMLSSAVHPLRVVVQDGQIHFIDFKTDQLEFKVIPQSSLSVIKKFLGDGRQGYHLLIVRQSSEEPLTFLFQMREFGFKRKFYLRPPFEDFKEDLQKIGVNVQYN